MKELTFIPKHKQGMISQQVDDEVLILNRQGAEIHQLNEVAAFIWEKCDDKNSIEIIVNLLLAHYPVTSEQAVNDVKVTIEQFLEKGLLE